MKIKVTLFVFCTFLAACVSAQAPITTWLVAGPFKAGVNGDPESMKKAFDMDVKISNPKEGESLDIEGESKTWQKFGLNNGDLNLDHIFSNPEFVYAYAYAEVEMDEAGEHMVGIGSDDGVKIWFNGELVHEKWIGRALKKNEDLVSLHFRKGKNTILAKIQNQQYGWAFSLELLGPESFANLMTEAAAGGMIDQVDFLLQQGADLNTVSSNGLTPWQSAVLKGRKDMADWLANKGAKTDIPFPSNERMADQLFKGFTDGTHSAATVLVAENGKILFAKGFGYANIEKKILATPETKFRIGSITKQFTASAILRLQEMGKLKVTDPLSKYIPDFPKGDQVTIHHLLTHTSGIHSYTNENNFVERVVNPITPEVLVNEIKQFPYDFEPGEKWSYNNSGYFILGYLIEKISGMSYEAFLKKQFFDPVGMKNTGVYQKGKKLTNEAIGYTLENGELKPALDWEMSWAGGAGILYSTVNDLYLWNEAMFNGKVLKPESFKAAMTPVRLNNGEKPQEFGEGGYGYGWGMGDFRGQHEISHSGGLHGFLTNLGWIPEQKMTITVLTNCTPTEFSDPGAFTLNLYEIYLRGKLEDQLSFSTQTPANFDLYNDFQGQYEYPGGALMRVTREGNQLFAQLGGQPKFEIFPKSETEFFWKVVDAQITFVRDPASNKITHAIHHQNGQTFNAPRVEADEEIKVDPAIYANYVGEYILEGLTMTIANENGHLMATIAGQPTVELFPKSNTEFFLKIVRAYVTFEVDDTGKATRLIIEQNGSRQVAERK